MDESFPYYPRRWWGASRASTALLKALTEEAVSEHNNYRGARLEMKLFYEAVSHDTPHSYHYSHKVGVGSTVVSYHPEDKGSKIWQEVSKTMSNHKTHYHIASLILACYRAKVMSMYYIKKQATSKNSVCVQLLLNLEDSGLWEALRRWTLQDTHLRILRIVRSCLPTPSSEDHHLKSLLSTLILIERFLEVNNAYLLWDKHGWLCNITDTPYTVDFKAQLSYFSTNEPEGSDAVGGTAHGSLSPQNPPFQQTELWHSSDL
jgi:hypothetical protein